MPIYFHYRDSLQKKSLKNKNQNKTKILPQKRNQLVYCINVLPGNLIVVMVSKNSAP